MQPDSSGISEDSESDARMPNDMLKHELKARQELKRLEETGSGPEQDKPHNHVTNPASTVVSMRPKQDRTKRPIVFVEYGCSPNDTGSHKLVTDSKRQREVRVHAAMASAEARKATIARREAQRRQQRSQDYSSLRILSSETKVKRSDSTDDNQAATSAVNQFRFHQLVEFVTELQGDGVWYLGPVERTSLAHKAMRANLAHAMTNSTTLYQASIFIAGTFSNTCGLPSSAVHMGLGLIVLRGASLEAIQSAVTAPDADSLTPVAIAMLAGWERRFGDRGSYEVHMLAWRSLALAPRALEEGHVSTLTNLTLETLRADLDDRAARRASSAIASQDNRGLVNIKSLEVPPRAQFTVPTGFSLIHLGRPEARSLLSIVSEASSFDPTTQESVSRMRTLGIQNIAWSANHSISCEPVRSYEDGWDDDELNALYHVRAANISVFGVLLQAAMQHHRVSWGMDLETALDVHTISCQHLRTRALMGTRFAELACWSRFVLCAISRDPPRDELILWLLGEQGIHTWQDLRILLSRYIPLEQYIGSQCRGFFNLLQAQRARAHISQDQMKQDPTRDS